VNKALRSTEINIAEETANINESNKLCFVIKLYVKKRGKKEIIEIIGQEQNY